MRDFERVEARRLLDGAAEGPASDDEQRCYACGCMVNPDTHFMDVSLFMQRSGAWRRMFLCAACTDDIDDRIQRMRRTLGVR